MQPFWLPVEVSFAVGAKFLAIFGPTLRIDTFRPGKGCNPLNPLIPGTSASRSRRADFRPGEGCATGTAPTLALDSTSAHAFFKRTH